MESAHPRVSVIVPVRNGREDLASLLQCLRAQTLPREHFEVVVADDGSTDGGTADVSTDDEHIRVAVGPPTNSYAARNRAVLESRGEILAFCDADCRPEPEWLVNGLSALRDGDVVAGRIRFIVPEQRNVWTIVDIDGSKDHQHQVRVGVAETANLFLRRSLFDQVGGFEGRIAEYGDFDFVERCVVAGASLTYAADTVVWHPARTSGKALLRALWKYHRGYAVHAARSGVVPDGVKLRSWVPVVQTLRARHRWGRSIGPDRRWLRANDVTPTPGEIIGGMLVLYFVIPYVGSTAQVAGWFEGRRLRRLPAREVADRDEKRASV